MKIIVRLELTSSKYRPDGNRETVLELPDGSTVATLLANLKVPENESYLIVRNGRVSSVHTALNPGDRVVLLPLLAGG